MKSLPKILLLLALALQPSSADERPNILLILADEMGYGDVQALNPDSQIPTPHLNGLAKNGTIFTDAHSGSAVCPPTP
ncbi:sulfatase-like hydrolase/transferase [Akkermansiaceae bacterium]|nr:sulfatase-like hydrolase/transferase [Akkermansiaceae bacterium]